MEFLQQARFTYKLIYEKLLLLICITILFQLLTYILSMHTWISFDLGTHSICPTSKKQATIPYYRGKIGNEMMNYAALLGVSKEFGYKPVIPKEVWLFLVSTFRNITAMHAPEHCFIGFKAVTEAKAESCSTNKQCQLPDRIKLIEENANYVLFLPHISDIKREFVFHETLQSEVRNYFKTIGDTDSVHQPLFVGIHIRRGVHDSYDKLLWKKYRRKLLTATWYFKAMERMITELKTENVLFVIVTDYPPWVQENFQNLPRVYFSFDYEPVLPVSFVSLDLAILASCHHSIVDYGTFSFWGAFLAGGITVSGSPMMALTDRSTGRNNISYPILNGWIILDD